MLKKFVTILGGDPNKREIDRLLEIVDAVNDLEPEFEALSDEALRAKTGAFRARLMQGESLDALLPEAFAAVREASKRTLGLRHYDVQLIGGMTLHRGKIAEMRTGEGKTLVATLPLYLNALGGGGAHLVTVNDYLARRDARWMAPIYNLLGMSVGVLQMAARTENGKKAFLIDLERESPHEDQHQLRMVPRQEAYAADITYGTNSEFGFDYLRDNMTLHLDERVQRGHVYAIVDEVDNVLIDEARTPLIISGPAQDESEWYIRMAQVVRQLRPEDLELDERERNVTLSELGEAHVEELLGVPLRDPDRPEDVTPEQARLLGYLEQALRAQHLFKRNKEYLVQGGKVVIVDEFTGRLMPGRRWSDGLHQAVEAKEGVRVQAENVTYATITIQNYFRMYAKLAGMTGTAVTESEEFHKIYKLDVLAIPTNLEYQALRSDAPLVILEGRDDEGYKYRYYARSGDPEKLPVFWQRKDFPDVIFRTEEAKFRAITREIMRYHAQGRPMLVGTTSVELSDHLSARLHAEPLRRLALVMLLRQAWMEQNQREEDGRQIAELELLYKPLEQLDLAALRKMGRELGISSNPEESSNLERLSGLLNLDDGYRQRLAGSLQRGILHQVLNARKHTEESQIIAGAGAFGAVTIATNMAGRGVDIKLGGELPEGIIETVNRVLRRAGVEEAYDMRMEERHQALLGISAEQYGIYEAEINQFLQYMSEMKTVKELGGLHVIGSERHEARRIDNQLRGRSARQGDPGSSRFYLSMEDELMHRFGGQQADGLMQRLKIDDAMPLEMGVVSRLIEQSQTRVEGANFDVRKHLLEYDDVLNSQRSRIYSQRDRIFSKEDLGDDVTEMLRTEINRRVPLALKDEEGPWKLLAWMEQVQPPLPLGGAIFPSYPLRLLLNQLEARRSSLKSTADVRQALLDLAGEALSAEEEHLSRLVEILLENTQQRLKEQLAERLEVLDNSFEGLDLDNEEEDAPRSPREFIDQLSLTLRMPIRISTEAQRALRENPAMARQEAQEQVETALALQSVTRLVGAVERRLEDSLELLPAQIAAEEWEMAEEQILAGLELALSRRRARLLGEGNGGGQIGKDLDVSLEKIGSVITTDHLIGLLIMIPQGTRATFDKKTHRRVLQRTTRLTYTYYAARLIASRRPEEITEEVLTHLEAAQSAMGLAWGLSEFSRLANSRLGDLEQSRQNRLRQVLGEEKAAVLQTQPLNSLEREDVQRVIDELGRRTLTEIYRQLLLNVITEQWVDYLTKMEALRVSIGLEAYAQRDPLVEYKNQASAMFQTLHEDIRIGVISRMFVYRPRDLGSQQSEPKRTALQSTEQEAEIVEAEFSESAAVPEGAGDEADVQAPVSEQTPQAGEEQLAAADRSRSQKRRRHRR